MYFKLVGSPYKTERHYSKVRYLGIICGVWSIAFGIKFLAFAFGKNLLTDSIETQSSSYSTAILLAVEDFISIVIPVFLVVDKDFIKIMAAEFMQR